MRSWRKTVVRHNHKNLAGKVTPSRKRQRKRLVKNKSKRLLEIQDHKCACCGIELTNDNITRDHDPWHHKHSRSSTRGSCSACLRAMLCLNCNNLVGDMETVLLSGKYNEIMEYVMKYAIKEASTSE